MSKKSEQEKSKSSNDLPLSPPSTSNATRQTKDEQAPHSLSSDHINQIDDSSASFGIVGQLSGIVISGASSVASGVASSVSAASSYLWTFLGDPSTGGETAGERSTVRSDKKEAPKSTSTESASSRSSKPFRAGGKSIISSRECDVNLCSNLDQEQKLILTQPLISVIHSTLPPRYRLSQRWSLLYSTQAHGYSLHTLYAQAKHHQGPTLLCVESGSGEIFGVFASETWKPHTGHYGSGECFLWTRDAACAGEEDEKKKNLKIIKYATTGKNDYYQLSEPSFLAAGCSDGKFGVWIDEDLVEGESFPVSTFDNDALCGSGGRWSIDGVELWGLDLSS